MMLQNKVGIVFGVANRRSIAWATTQALHDAGARLAFTYEMLREQPCNINTWSHGDVMFLISLLITILACVAAVLVVPEFRRWIGLDHAPAHRDILIVTPANKGEIIQHSNEVRPIQRPIAGKIVGYTEDEIERLGLQVEVLIKTDRWYLQGIVPVVSNGKWRLEAGHFGGRVHVIRAILKDKDSRELFSTDIEVTLI